MTRIQNNPHNPSVPNRPMYLLSSCERWHSMLRKLGVFLAFTVFMAVVAFSQTKSFTNDDVLQMTKAGFDEQTIVKAIQTHEPAYDTSINALVALKNTGVK